MEELNKIFLDFKDGFIHLLPKLLIALLVFGFGYLLARLVRLIIRRFLGYISQRTKRQFKDIDFTPSTNFIETTFFWLILLYTFFIVADILGLGVIKSWMDSILQYTPNLIAAILIILAALILGKLISAFILSAGKQLGLNYAATLGKIAQFFVLITSIIIAIDQIGIEVAFLTELIDITLAALLFGAALAFGIGARTSVSNILAAFYVRKMYKEGDHVKIGETEGIITRIDATMVILDNEDGHFSIPAKIFSETKSFLIKK
jgi:small-conductance mechanosensitive channel